MKRLINLLLTLVSISYPLLWLWQHKHGQINILFFFPALFALLWGARAIYERQPMRYFSLLMMLLFVGITAFRRLDTLYWYPVLINVFLLIIFASSLWQKQTVVERLARLKTPDLPTKAISYTRKVTILWCAVFSLNIGLCTAFITYQRFDLWAIYSGVISYILMAVVMIGEWLVRQFLQKEKE
ncbi:hypothetical protein [Lonepinella sp. MS14435]|uniref:COG4648 family protein n=1 Tax=unclassified Lonepinella TaxID=2642006 RepID=UPI0036DA435E